MEPHIVSPTSVRPGQTTFPQRRGLMRVFSGSCMSLDDMDFHLPQLIPRDKQLGPGQDHFDEEGIPQRPVNPCHAMSKVFSGSALDLADMNPDEEDDDRVTPLNNSKTYTMSPSGGLEPATDSSNSNSNPNSLQTISDNSDQTLSTMLERINTESEHQRAAASKSRITVLVVGGAGFLGSHIVSRLLDQGYSVKATVSNTNQVKELFLGVADAQHLAVSEVNMRSPMGFKDIVRGCHYVIHCGVPSVGINENIVEVHVAVVKALFDAIRTYAKTTVKRVILTGNSASICSNLTTLPPGAQSFDESCWNDVTEQQDPFTAAKVQFEKEAWRLKALHDIEMSVVIPSIMIGPSFTCEVSEAMRLLQGLGSQSRWFPFAPMMFWNFVDVRDVAEAHIKALECSLGDNERFIVNGESLCLPQVGRMIRQSHPHLLAPTRASPLLLTLVLGPINSGGRVSVKYLWKNLGRVRRLDTTKARKQLHFEYTAIQTTIKDAVAELIAGGHLPSQNDPAVLGRTSTGAVVTMGVLAGLAVGLAVFALQRRRQ